MKMEIDGNSYVIAGALDGFAQLRMARKLAPASHVVEGLLKTENLEKERNLLMVLMLSNISERDSEEVIKSCLSIVHRVEDGGTAPIMKNGVLMYDDLTLAAMLEIALVVINEYLGDFFRTALDNLKVAAKQSS